MAFSKYLKGYRLENKGTLNNALSNLKRNLINFKTERLSEWELFRDNFNDDMEKMEKLSKKKNNNHRNNI